MTTPPLPPTAYEVVQAITTCGAAPVQIEGHLDDGRYLYFRARGEEIRLGISPHSVEDAVDATFACDQPDRWEFRAGDRATYWTLCRGEEGQRFPASWLDHDVAYALLDKWVAALGSAEDER